MRDVLIQHSPYKTRKKLNLEQTNGWNYKEKIIYHWNRKIQKKKYQRNQSVVSFKNIHAQAYRDNSEKIICGKNLMV